MSINSLRLYIGNKNYSSWSLRAWLVLKQTGLPFEETVIPLDRGETRERIREHSPSRRVPVLKHEDITVWESLAIAEYLAEIAPSARLWPEDTSARAVARAVSSEMHAGFVAMRAHMPMDVRSRCPRKAKEQDIDKDIERIVEIWSDCRQQYGKRGDFLFGAFGIADAIYAPAVSRFITYGVDLDSTAAQYCDAVWNWPPMKEWANAAESEPWVLGAPKL